MRVCLVTSAPFPPREGLGFHVWNLADQLSARGHGVTIMTRGTLKRPTREMAGPVAIWRVPFAPLYPVHVHLHGVYMNSLLHRLEGEFDVVNPHSPLPPVLDTRLPIVTTFHSPMRSDTARTASRDLHALLVRLQTPVSESIERGLLQRSGQVTAVAGWVAEELRAYGVDPASVAITGNGMEATFLQAAPLQKREPFALYVGRLAIGKGLEELIEAARMVQEWPATSGLRFVIVGEGPLRAKLEEMAIRAGLAGCIEFRGQLSAERRAELVDLYRRAALFVLPSHHEGMPTVLLEAMAAGAPVVSTAVGGALEVVSDGENGMLVPPGDPDALANAMLLLLEDPAQARRLGESARETVRRRFSWDAVSERYLASYRQVTGRDGMRA